MRDSVAISVKSVHLLRAVLSLKIIPFTTGNDNDWTGRIPVDCTHKDGFFELIRNKDQNITNTRFSISCYVAGQHQFLLSSLALHITMEHHLTRQLCSLSRPSRSHLPMSCSQIQLRSMNNSTTVRIVGL